MLFFLALLIYSCTSGVAGSCDGYKNATQLYFDGIRQYPVFVNSMRGRVNIYLFANIRGALVNAEGYMEKDISEVYIRSYFNTLQKRIPAQQTELMLTSEIPQWENKTVQELLDCLPELPPLCQRNEPLMEYCSYSFRSSFNTGCSRSYANCSAYLTQQFKVLAQDAVLNDKTASPDEKYEVVQNFLDSLQDEADKNETLSTIMVFWGGLVQDFVDCFNATNCFDAASDCAQKAGYCARDDYRDLMLLTCRKTCKFCNEPLPECKDEDPACPNKAQVCGDPIYQNLTLLYCRKTCKHC